MPWAGCRLRLQHGPQVSWGAATSQIHGGDPKGLLEAVAGAVSELVAQRCVHQMCGWRLRLGCSRAVLLYPMWPSQDQPALEALAQLSEACGPALNPHVEKLAVPCHNKTKVKGLHGAATAALQALHCNGGDEALKIIQRKVGSFRPVS